MTAPWGPAAVRLFAWLGSLPTSDVWEAWDGEETDRNGLPVAPRSSRRGSGSPYEAPGISKAQIRGLSTNDERETA